MNAKLSGTSGVAKWEWSTKGGKNATKNAVRTPIARLNRAPMR